MTSVETMQNLINKLQKVLLKEKLTSEDIFDIMTILIYGEQELWGEIDADNLSKIGENLNTLIIENKGKKEVEITKELTDILKLTFEEIKEFIIKENEPEK